jgi:hypothetical protein
MSFLLAVHDLASRHTALLADDPIPKYTVKLPDVLQSPTAQILGWTAGGGLAAAVRGGLIGWGMVAVGHNTERGGLAARGKQGIMWSLISGLGIGLTSGLILTFYKLATG